MCYRTSTGSIALRPAAYSPATSSPLPLELRRPEESPGAPPVEGGGDSEGEHSEADEAAPSHSEARRSCWGSSAQQGAGALAAAAATATRETGVAAAAGAVPTAMPASSSCKGVGGRQ